MWLEKSSQGPQLKGIGKFVTVCNSVVVRIVKVSSINIMVLAVCVLETSSLSLLLWGIRRRRWQLPKSYTDFPGHRSFVTISASTTLLSSLLLLLLLL